MAGLTPQEQARLDKIIAASNDPNQSGGEGFNVQILVYMFQKIVDLRDFAQDQVDTNNQLRARIKRLEDLVWRDNAEVYVHIGVSGEDIRI